MKTTKLYSIGLVAIMIFTFSQQAFSQDSRWAYGSHYQSFINTLMTNSIYVNPKAYTKNKKPGNSDASKSSDDFPGLRILDPPKVRDERINRAVQFKSTGTRLKVTETAELIDPVPEDRAETRKILSGILDKYEAVARANGYPDDLAFAILSSIFLLAAVYHEQQTAPFESIVQIPFERLLESRNLLAEALVRDGSFDKITDRQKQEMYEVLIMNAGNIYRLCEKAKKENDAEELKDCKPVAAQLLKDRGIKL